MIHAAADLLVAGAMLDDLSPDERAAYDEHRPACRGCAVLEDELGVLLTDLALVVPERVPPPDLLAGIHLAIAAESAPVRLSTRPRYAVLALAAVVALVAVGIGARTIGLQDRLDQSTALVASLRAEMATQGGAIAAAMDPGHVTVALHAEPLAPDATAMVVFIPGTTSAYLVAQHLPATPSGHAYQLWYADAAGVHPLQTVRLDADGAFVAPLGVALTSGAAVMVTLEPTGGSTGDPGPQVVFGDL
ncbi:MAG: anti-sigma factor [Candidatus Limnocylindrales bacterium]